MAINRGTKPVRKWRFFKSGLPAIIWDPQNDKPLAEFKDGSFITEDEQTAKILKQKGYPEVGLRAQEPPDITVIDPGRSLKEGENIPILKGNVNEKVGQARTQQIVDDQPKAPEILK